MTRQEKVSAIVNLICSRNYGDTVTHTEMSAVIEEPVRSQKYRDIIGTANKRCVELGRMVRSVRGVGYQLVEPDDYTRQSVRCIVSGAKRIDSGVKILAHAPVSQMSQPGLEEYNRVNDRVRVLQASVAGAKVEIGMLANHRQHPLLQQTHT